MTRCKEKIIYKNECGKIVCLEDRLFGGTRYVLLDSAGNYVQDIPFPFKVSDYL